MSIFLILPIKTLSNSKTRLSKVLSLEERKALMIAMIKDVLTAVKNSKKVNNVVIISQDLNILKLNKEFNFEFIKEEFQYGLNYAIQNAIEFCIKKNAKSVLIIPADIPLILAKDLDKIINLGKNSSIVIAPSKNGKGTNALMLTPPNIIQPKYGENSFYFHVNEAKIKGIDVKVYKSKRVALDIDTPEDLIDFIKIKTNTYTYRLLTELKKAIE